MLKSTETMVVTLAVSMISDPAVVASGIDTSNPDMGLVDLTKFFVPTTT